MADLVTRDVAAATTLREPSTSSVRTFPVIEVFGPTIQGEGALAGLPTLFVRFGGCDYRCSWCDSMYAVEPALVREHAERLTAVEVVQRCRDLADGRERPNLYVTLSGGNPALMNFDGGLAEGGENMLPTMLRNAGFRVSVETQGSLWRPWLETVTHLTVSPKPPSSGMVTDQHRMQTARFLDRAEEMYGRKRSLKVVVFDDADYEYARDLFKQRARSGWRRYLSVGTDQPHPDDGPGVNSESGVREVVCDRYRWLCEKAAADPVMTNVRVYPQLHVLAWGHARGV